MGVNNFNIKINDDIFQFTRAISWNVMFNGLLNNGALITQYIIHKWEAIHYAYTLYVHFMWYKSYAHNIHAVMYCLINNIPC